MKRVFVLAAALSLTLAACGVDTTGLSKESSRTVTGNPNASVTVTEYGDLQCPACRGAYELLNKPLLEQYGSRIRFEFMHFPLRSLHRYALNAALASECAADQGKFWEFVDYNYEHQTEMSPETLSDTWPKALKLDMQTFERCYKSQIKKSTILDDYKKGQKLGVEGTPTYFVNGEKLEDNTMAALTGAILKILGPLDQRL